AGDEFAVLLVGCDADGARAAAEHLRGAIADHPYRRGDIAIELAVRFGVSQIRRGEDSGAPALARAEAALRRARRRSSEITLPEPGAETEPSGARPLAGDGDSIPA